MSLSKCMLSHISKYASVEKHFHWKLTKVMHFRQSVAEFHKGSCIVLVLHKKSVTTCYLVSVQGKVGWKMTEMHPT